MSVVAHPVRMPPGDLRKISVDEFHRMVDAGVLPEGERIELLEGWLVRKMVHNPRHDATVDRTRDTLQRHLPADWRVRVQSAITTSDSEPEPDIAVVLGPAGRYQNRHPGASDIAVVVEVADSSLSHDRDFKSRVYAQAAIPVYWIVNLLDNVVEVRQLPNPGDLAPHYRQKCQCGIGEMLELSLPGGPRIAVAVRDLFEDPA